MVTRIIGVGDRRDQELSAFGRCPVDAALAVSAVRSIRTSMAVDGVDLAGQIGARSGLTQAEFAQQGWQT